MGIVSSPGLVSLHFQSRRQRTESRFNIQLQHSPIVRWYFGLNGRSLMGGVDVQSKSGRGSIA